MYSSADILYLQASKVSSATSSPVTATVHGRLRRATTESATTAAKRSPRVTAQPSPPYLSPSQTARARTASAKQASAATTPARADVPLHAELQWSPRLVPRFTSPCAVRKGSIHSTASPDSLRAASRPTAAVSQSAEGVQSAVPDSAVNTEAAAESQTVQSSTLHVPAPDCFSSPHGRHAPRSPRLSPSIAAGLRDSSWGSSQPALTQGISQPALIQGSSWPIVTQGSLEPAQTSMPATSGHLQTAQQVTAQQTHRSSDTHDITAAAQNPVQARLSEAARSPLQAIKKRQQSVDAASVSLGRVNDSQEEALMSRNAAEQNAELWQQLQAANQDLTRGELMLRALQSKAAHRDCL